MQDDNLGAAAGGSEPHVHPLELLRRITIRGGWSVFAVSWHPGGNRIAVATETAYVRASLRKSCDGGCGAFAWPTAATRRVGCVICR